MKQPEAALGELLTGYLRAHHRRLRAFDAADWERYGELLHGAFLLAVRRRFAAGVDRAAIIRFVASVRERYDRSGTDIEPGPAEELVRAALGDRQSVPVTAQTVTAWTMLLVGLLEDEGMPESEVVAFVNATGAAGYRRTGGVAGQG